MSVTKNYKKYANLDEEYIVDTIEERKSKIISLSDVYLILPGGWGTFEEIGSIVGGKANKLYSKPIAFYNFEGYYNTFIAFLDEMYSKRFSKISPSEVFYASANLNNIFSYFNNYSVNVLKDKFS